MRNPVIIICIIFIYITKQTYCYNQHRNDDIDDFIKKLISSEKFDELADIIAEKAARKIKNLDKTNVSNLRHGGTKENYSNRVIKPKGTYDGPIKTSEREKYKPEMGNVKYKLSNINPKVFIKNDASYPQEKLSLNFKHLMKSHNIKIDNNKERIKSSEDIKKYQKRLTKENNENGDGAYRNNDNKVAVETYTNKLKHDEELDFKKSLSDKSSEIRKPESNEDDEEKERPVSNGNMHEIPFDKRQEDVQTSNEKLGSKDSDEIPQRNPKPAEQEQISENDKQPELDDNKNEEMNEDYVNEKPSRTFRSNPKENLERRNSLKINEHDHESELNTTLIDVDNKNQIKNQIRQEAGGKFMYEPSPDYDEYYEKLATSQPPNIESFLT